MKRDNFHFIVQSVTHFIFKVSFRIQLFTDFSISSVNLKAIPIQTGRLNPNQVSDGLFESC